MTKEYYRIVEDFWVGQFTGKCYKCYRVEKKHWLFGWILVKRNIDSVEKAEQFIGYMKRPVNVIKEFK